MIDASRKISTIRVLEEAFRCNGSNAKASQVKKDPTQFKQLFTVGKMLCLIMFAFRNGRESVETVEEIEAIRNEQVNKEFERWENI